MGAVWFGLIYNGHIWGLYEISYFERSPLVGENSLQAFMLLIGIYGAGQLIVVCLLSGRTETASFILLVVTLHAVGMKSKFPLFWIVFLFVVVAIGRRKQLLRLILPIGISVGILSIMSILRGVSDISELPQYIETYGDVISETAVTPWNNDLPGPASITYYVVNSVEDYTIMPITEIISLLIPKFIADRGQILSEVYSQKMLGSQYELGLGFGWSPLCDGFILAGWVGIGLVAFVFAGLARYIDELGDKSGDRIREYFLIVSYSASPFFLYGIRESMVGHLKQLLIISVLVWLPTYFLSRLRVMRPFKVRLS